MRDDERLRAALKNLPRARAAEDFTERLLTRMDQRQQQGRHAADAVSVRWLVTAAAVVLAALALSLLFVHSDRESLTPEEQAEVHRLLEQHQRLEEDLAAVRREVQDSQPVLYLEGLPARDGRRVDLVMEVPTDIRPAVYRLD